MTDGVLASIGWERLRSETGSQTTNELGVPSLVLGVSVPAGPVRLAIGAEREARLLIPLATGERFPSVGDTHGLELKDIVLLLRGVSVRFIDVTCRGARLEAVFNLLVADVVRRLASGRGASDALEEAVADFRNLLMGASRDRPTVETALGLLGELIILNKLLEFRPDAGELWTGPMGGRHDFRGGDRAIEVKTSMRAQTKTIEVSAIDQLAAPDGGELLLAHFQLEYDAGGALSVTAEVEKALRVASDPSVLVDRLAMVGFIPEMKGEWSAFRFSLLMLDHYSVAEGFPRLTPATFAEGSLPPGVSHFRYRVDLGFATEFRLRPAAVNGAIEEILACLPR